MTYVEFLVEEESSKETILALAPRILGDADVTVHAFQGKRDLLKKLPDRLRGYRQSACQEWDPLIVILVDADSDDCTVLKSKLEEVVAEAGLQTCRSAESVSTAQVVTWIAVEELEAWFIGDPQALCRAYPRVPSSYANRSAYRDPDAVRGGTWEALERLIQEAGYCREGMGKVENARRIAACMDPQRNRSRSFQGFVRRLKCLVP